MNAPTPEEARNALDALAIYAAAGASKLPAENTLRRFIDAHSAPVPIPDCTVTDVGFRWNSETQEHIPHVFVQFTPVAANSPADAKGWADRDAFAALLASPPPAPVQPEPVMVNGLTEAETTQTASVAGLSKPVQPEPVAWIPVVERMPASGVTVLACYTNRSGNVRRIRAEWVAAKTIESDGDSEIGEYDEATDCCYDPEGWYEKIDNWGDYSSVVVNEGEVTHWMPLPAHPGASPPPAQPATDPLDTPLPCDVKVGNGTHRKGTSLRTLVNRMQMLHEAAFGPEQPQAEKDANLAVLQGAAQPAQAEFHNPWRTSLENCISGDNYLRASEYRDLIEELDELYRLRAAQPPREPVQPLSDTVSVCKTDANNYCRILTALGMEEEGDPVAEIERLITERMSAGGKT